MKAPLINLPINTAPSSYDMIDRNWHDLTKDEDKEISEKLKRVMNIVKYLVSTKEYKKFTYPYFIKILKRSQDQVRRYFDEFEETGLGKIKFKKKLLRENGVTQWRCLDIKLTKKGAAELGLENLITLQAHTAGSHRTNAACYIDNNTDIKKQNNNTDISIDIDTYLNHKTEIEKIKTEDQQNQFKNGDFEKIEELVLGEQYLQNLLDKFDSIKEPEEKPYTNSKDLMLEVLASMAPKLEPTPQPIRETATKQKVCKVYDFKIPLREYKLNKESFDTLRRLSNKSHFTDDQIRVVIQNITEKNPNTMIFGRKKAFTNYMVKVLNGESEYTNKEKAESIADRERKEYEQMLYNYENRIIVWG